MIWYPPEYDSLFRFMFPEGTAELDEEYKIFGGMRAGGMTETFSCTEDKDAR